MHISPPSNNLSVLSPKGRGNPAKRPITTSATCPIRERKLQRKETHKIERLCQGFYYWRQISAARST
jgi:hypothetical protein